MKVLMVLALFAVSPAAIRAADASRLFESIEPSVVLITSEEGGGSGVVITEDGLILTNFHVANTPLPMTVEALVTGPGGRVRKQFPNIRLQKVHPTSDLALLKVDAPGVRFQPVRLSKAASDSKSGGTCFALGFPYLPDQDKPVITITRGIINSNRREVAGNSYLQLDAAINPGNSGGALVNEHGILIGIPTLRYEGADRVGLATPILGLRIDQFVAPKERKGNAAEAARIARMADAYLLRDGLSLGTDPESAAIALFLLREALGLDPNNAQWAFLIASLNQRFERPAVARAYAEFALGLDPDHLRARLMLAIILDSEKKPAEAAALRLACLPLLEQDPNEHLGKEVFTKLIDHYSGSGQSLRAIYLMSWEKAAPGGDSAPSRQLVIQRATEVLPQTLIDSIFARSAGHNLVELEKLVRDHPQSEVKQPTEPLAPADAGRVREATVENPVILSEVRFKDGVTVTLADAPAGVVYMPEHQRLEWTLPAFSNATEAGVLFLLTHPDGTEEQLIHTIRRE